MIRFMRTAEVRSGYALFDAGRLLDAISYCTAQLAQSGADPELRLLRGECYFNQEGDFTLDDAVADWEQCTTDPELGGVAHYYLGNFFRGKRAEYLERAWMHYEQASALGWVEGNIGMGFMLFDEWLRLVESDDLSEGLVRLRRAIVELGVGLTSPSISSQKRALTIRADAFYHLGDNESCKRDIEAQKQLHIGNSAKHADHRTLCVHRQ